MEHNFVRAEYLTLGSIEFFAILFVVVLAVLKYKLNLIKTYILMLPFTDAVYRIASMQPSDILSALIVIRYAKRIKINLLFFVVFIVLLYGSIVGYFKFDSLFSIAYSIRVLLVILTSIIILDLISENESLRIKIIEIYKIIVYFSVFIGFMQAVLWLIGLPIDGVFYVGYVRVKGLAHEPSTFAVWLALSLPIVISHVNSKMKIDYKLLTTIFVGFVLTSSATATILALFSMIMFIVLSDNISHAKKIFGFFVISFIVFILMTVFSDVVYENIIVKIQNYITELTDINAEDKSGRGGDRYLFYIFKDYIYIGIGVFRSTQIAESLSLILGEDIYIPGSNFFLTTFVELGMWVGSFTIVIFIAWMIFILKNTLKGNLYWGISMLSWGIALFGMRIFAFHQPWLNYTLMKSEKK